MKIILSVLSFLFIHNNVLASEPQKIAGKFKSTGAMELVELHTWEKGDWETPEGIARRKELSNQGYGCFRRNPKQFMCHIKSVSETLPEDVKTYVADFIKNYSIEFVGPFEDPKDMIDTSTEREWWIEGAVVINGSKVRGYKWTHQYNPHNDLIVLPVNDEQPIPWFVFKNNELLHLPLQLQQKNGTNVTKTFRIEAQFIKQ
ncbi:MAG: hypothetical protein ACXVCP_08115 [Bdellovibrio sp.]